VRRLTLQQGRTAPQGIAKPFRIVGDDGHHGELGREAVVPASAVAGGRTSPADADIQE
jgi:hypothetical protein